MTKAAPAPMPVVAANVRAEIARRDLTQKQVAVYLGLSQQNLSQRIRGHVKFRDHELATLAQLLGVSVAALKGEKP